MADPSKEFDKYALSIAAYTIIYTIDDKPLRAYNAEKDKNIIPLPCIEYLCLLDCSMATLIITLPEPVVDIGSGDTTLRASITHLRVSEHKVGTKGLILESTPGILLLTPSRAGARVQIHADVFDIPHDMVLVARGRGRKEIFPASADPHDSLVPRLRIIELNVRLNDCLDLVETINPPFVLDFESSELVINVLHRQHSLMTPIIINSSTADAAGLFMATELLGCVLRASGQTPTGLAQTAADNRMLKLKSFLLSNIDRHISTTEMAAELGMSRSGFGSWSRKQLTCPPAQYLKELRLDQTQEWLAQGMHNIEHVATRAGFADRFSFSKAFKLRFGLPPGQYARTQGGDVSTIDFLARAANLYHRHCFERALAACEEGLQFTSGDVHDRLRYQRSLCLQSLGQTAKAMAEWQSLKTSTCAYEVGVRLSRHLFNTNRYDEALEQFRSVYAISDHSQQDRLVPLWIDQALSLRAERQAAPLHRYLALYRELFPSDNRAVNIAIECCRELGEHELVYSNMTTHPLACFFAMRRAGKPDDALARFGCAIPKNHIAFTFHHFGRHEELLAYEFINPYHAVEALTELGRPEEAIRRYPDHCQRAYLALERYEALIELFPEPTPEYVYALHALNQFDRLKRFQFRESAPWLWYTIQMYVCPDAILETDQPDAHIYAPNALLLKALGYLQQGDRPKAEEALQKIKGVRAPDLWWGEHNSVELLLVSLTHAFLGDRQRLQADLDAIAVHHKIKDEQILWHDAGYIGGTVSATAYQQQPQRSSLNQRFIFIQAVAHDLKGQRNEARAAYEHFRKAIQPYPSVNLLRHRFAEWRLQEL